MNSNINFSSLPELAKLKIFTSLPGGALHRSRQVCREWNFFILNHVWNSTGGRKEIMKIIRENWQPPLNYKIFNHTYDMSRFGNEPLLGEPLIKKKTV